MSKRYFKLIYAGELIKGEGKVIPAHEFEKLLSGAELLDQAQEDIAFYFKQNKKRCRLLQKKAKEDGFEEGLAQFYEHLLRCDQNLRDLEAKLQQMILPLALKAAKKIVSAALEIDPNLIVEIIMRTLRPVTQNLQVKIFVSPEDKERVEAKREEFKELLEHARFLKIVEDPKIHLGGCIVETEVGVINATWENQWRAIEKAFNIFRQTPPPPDLPDSHDDPPNPQESQDPPASVSDPDCR